MADKQQAPLDSHAVDIVAVLATEAAAPAILNITTSGLGDGLPSSVPVAFDRKNQVFRSVQALIEEQRQFPARRKGTATADTLESFINLVNRHKDDRSALFGRCIWPDPKLTAVIDYDDATGTARNRQHRVVYTFPLTEEFKTWVEMNAKPMPQDVFAAFLEEHAAELASPQDGERSEYERLFNEKMATPSEVVALSRHLEVFVSARVKNGIRLQTGERTVEFKEEHQDAKGEAVVIPGIFMVSVPAFVDGDPVRIPARLRYRIVSGDIKWFYQLYRWEFFLREQVERDLETAAGETELPAFEGAPEA
jgi:uncharacterized protein YfdQ (DUF2303 family)